MTDLGESDTGGPVSPKPGQGRITGVTEDAACEATEAKSKAGSALPESLTPMLHMVDKLAGLNGYLGEVARGSGRLAEFAKLNESLTRAIAPFGQLFEAREFLGRQVSILASSGVRAMVEQFDKNNMAASVQQSVLGSMEAISRTALGNSMLTGELSAQWAKVHALDMLHQVDVSQLGALRVGLVGNIASITKVAGLVESRNSLLARLAPILDVARPVVLATRAWEDVLQVTPRHDPSLYLPRFDVAGKATGWAIQAGIALTEKDNGRVVSMEAETAVALGPAEASAELRLRLTGISPALRDKLDGAWERLMDGGADATSQAANSLMELVDWTLRFLAPDADVLAWHTAERRPAKELHESRPTRQLRVRFAVRNQPEKNSTIDLYLKAIQGLVDAIQGAKHGHGQDNRRGLIPVAMTVEGFLHFLLLY